MSILDLWQPILASAVLVWVGGAVIWMVMPWHKSDFAQTSNEDSARSALSGLVPGQYSLPYCPDQKSFEDEGMKQKFKDGPVGFVTIVPSGPPAMGGKLAMMFGYNLLVGIVCAYFVSRTAASGADYLAVFRVAGAVAFVAYGMAYIQESIWFGRPWSTTTKTFLDALIYGLLTGGAFGWLAA